MELVRRITEVLSIMDMPVTGAGSDVVPALSDSWPCCCWLDWQWDSTLESQVSFDPVRDANVLAWLLDDFPIGGSKMYEVQVVSINKVTSLYTNKLNGRTTWIKGIHIMSEISHICRI